MKRVFNSFLCSIISFCCLHANAQESNFYDQDVANSEFVYFEKPSLMKNDMISKFDFELPKYLGLWYEQAHLPTFFQKDCDSSTALYSLNDDSSIKVLNTCYRLNGDSKNIVGKAKVDANDTSGRSLIVSFNFFTDIVNFFKGVNYYVYQIDESYNYAIVGTPKKDMLWILTREKTLSQDKLAELINTSEKLGFNTSEIIYDKR